MKKHKQSEIQIADRKFLFFRKGIVDVRITCWQTTKHPHLRLHQCAYISLQASLLNKATPPLRVDRLDALLAAKGFTATIKQLEAEIIKLHRAHKLAPPDGVQQHAAT